MTHGLCLCHCGGCCFCCCCWSSTLIRFLFSCCTSFVPFFFPAQLLSILSSTCHIFSTNDSIRYKWIIWNSGGGSCNALGNTHTQQMSWSNDARNNKKDGSKCNYGLSLNFSSLWNFVIKIEHDIKIKTSISDFLFIFKQTRLTFFNVFLLVNENEKRKTKNNFDAHICCFYQILCLFAWLNFQPMSIAYFVFAFLFLLLFNPCELKALFSQRA